MSSETAIRTSGLAKCYALFDRPSDRLKQMLWRGRRKYYREFWALREVDLEIRRGEVLGIVGHNGAGKSTLLQLICGTLTPTAGSVTVNGRVAALLELGAGFNPEFSGRENVYLAAAVLGLTPAEIDARFEEIVDFSGIRDFIDQPVKTYSSGMYVRLAFSISTSVDPDILVIDEALSVGDGQFARKSFDRIMALKEAGKTILFCSHSLYHIEAICTRAIWLDQGTLKMVDQPAKVVSAYSAAINGLATIGQTAPAHQAYPGKAAAHITRIDVLSDGRDATCQPLRSGIDPLEIAIAFSSDPALPAPSVAMCLTSEDGRIITSAGTHNDGFQVERDANGNGAVRIAFPGIALLKGDYWLHVLLMCERAIHVYESVDRIARIVIEQQGLEHGVVSLPHAWAPATHHGQPKDPTAPAGPD
jgi:lipopolysaccharide transport system ATP-binding protein